MKNVCFVGQAWNETFGSRVNETVDKHADPATRVALLDRFDAHYALTGKVGEKIAALLGVHRLEFLSEHRRTNLNRRFTGKNGKGDAFDAIEGRRVAAELVASELHDRFVLLGSEVCKCFGVPYDHLATVAIDGKRFFCLPHPSGINIWYNNPVNKERASKALRTFVNEK